MMSFRLAKVQEHRAYHALCLVVLQCQNIIRWLTRCSLASLKVAAASKYCDLGPSLASYLAPSPAACSSQRTQPQHFSKRGRL